MLYEVIAEGFDEDGAEWVGTWVIDGPDGERAYPVPPVVESFAVDLAVPWRRNGRVSIEIAAFEPARVLVDGHRRNAWTSTLTANPIILEALDP